MNIHDNLIKHKELTREDKEEVFRLATGGLVHAHGDQFVDGMSDEELRHALENALGTFGGSAAPNRPSVCHKGAGLKIWGAWDVTDHINDTPLFEGKATLQMARDMYGISDPDDKQMQLF